MNIEGTYTLQALPEEVGECLTDPQILQRTFPGIVRLESLDTHKYAITLHIRQAPLSGIYSGLIVVIEQEHPYQYSIAAEGEGRPGKMSTGWVVELSRLNENTVARYKGTVNPGRLTTLLPAPLVRGAIKLLLQQFFTSLSEQLHTMSSLPAIESSNMAGPSASNLPESNQVALSPAAQFPRLYAIVRQFGLGGGNPIDEGRWVNRLRRAGMISALLLLVWIGTRLPRRFIRP